MPLPAAANLFYWLKSFFTGNETLDRRLRIRFHDSQILRNQLSEFVRSHFLLIDHVEA